VPILPYVKSQSIPREWTPRVGETIDREFERIALFARSVSNDLSVISGGGSPFLPAPATPEYILGAAAGSLPNSRVVTDSADVTWGLGTLGQVSAAFGPRAALSVLGRAANSVGVPADIVAASASTVLRRNAANALEFAKVDLGVDVQSRLPYANLVAATAASVLVGRGSAAGAGNLQEITLGTGLTMTNQVLSASGASTGHYEPLTDGDLTQPELIFDSFGDVIMVFVP